MQVVKQENNSLQSAGSNVSANADMEKPFDSEQGMRALFALLGSLSSYVLNPDVWWLAKNDAKRVAVNQYGVSPEVFDATMERFEKARKAEAQKSVLKDLY